jgi:hypothetical protein
MWYRRYEVFDLHFPWAESLLLLLDQLDLLILEYLEYLGGLLDPLLQQHLPDLLRHWFLQLPLDLLNLEYLGVLPDLLHHWFLRLPPGLLNQLDLLHH